MKKKHYMLGPVVGGGECGVSQASIFWLCGRGQDGGMHGADSVYAVGLGFLGFVCFAATGAEQVLVQLPH